MTIDPFYPVVPDCWWIARLAPTGVGMIQLRSKLEAPDALRREIERAMAICASRGICLVINDHWEMAIELGAHYIHLGQGDLNSADLDAIRQAGIRFGISTHGLAELDRALACRPDYVALGPIYPTKLKKMPWAPQGLARLRQWRERLGQTPLVAIGGFRPELAAEALRAGASSIAVVTDLVTHPDPERRCKQWLQVTR